MVSGACFVEGSCHAGDPLLESPCKAVFPLHHVRRGWCDSEADLSRVCCRLVARSFSFGLKLSPLCPSFSIANYAGGVHLHFVHLVLAREDRWLLCAMPGRPNVRTVRDVQDGTTS